MTIYTKLIPFAVIAIVLTLIGVFIIERCVEEPYEKRIGVLETEVDVLKKIRHDTVDGNSVSELKLRVESLSQEIRNTDAKLRSDYNLFFQAGIPLTILGLLGFIYSLYSKVYNTAVEESKKEVARQFNSEETLKVEKKIAILSKPGADTVFLERFFKRMGFECFRTMDYKDGNVDYLNYDLVLINNDFNPNDENVNRYYFSEGERKAIFEKIRTKQIIFFYFGGQDLAADIRSHQQCASTNLKPQLYGNLINALKFQKML